MPGPITLSTKACVARAATALLVARCLARFRIIGLGAERLKSRHRLVPQTDVPAVAHQIGSRADQSLPLGRTGFEEPIEHENHFSTKMVVIEPVRPVLPFTGC